MSEKEKKEKIMLGNTEFVKSIYEVFNANGTIDDWKELTGYNDENGFYTRRKQVEDELDITLPKFRKKPSSRATLKSKLQEDKETLLAMIEELEKNKRVVEEKNDDPEPEVKQVDVNDLPDFVVGE